MQYGLGGGFEIAETAGKAGFAFLEVNVVKVLKPRESEAAFAPTLELIRNAPISWSICSSATRPLSRDCQPGPSNIVERPLDPVQSSPAFFETNSGIWQRMLACSTEENHSCV